MADLYRAATRILRDNGFELKRHGKGDHELWWNPRTRIHTVVARKVKSHDTANKILKQARLPKAF